MTNLRLQDWEPGPFWMCSYLKSRKQDPLFWHCESQFSVFFKLVAIRDLNNNDIRHVWRKSWLWNQKHQLQSIPGTRHWIIKMVLFFVELCLKSREIIIKINWHCQISVTAIYYLDINKICIKTLMLNGSHFISS